MTEEEISQQLFEAGEAIQRTINSSFKDWPEKYASAACMSVLSELCVLYALCVGVNQQTFFTQMLKLWVTMQKQAEQEPSSEHLH